MSTCISPSTSSAGAMRRRMASASRIFRDEGVSRLPKLLWLIRATLGSSPKPRTSAAARIAVSAIRAALGSKLTLVSAMNSAPPSSTRAWTAEASLICGRSPITSTMWRRWVREAADRAGQHRVGLAARQHHGGDRGPPGPQRLARGLGRDALAADPLEVERDIVVVARVAGRVDQLVVLALRAGRGPSFSTRASMTSGRPIRIGLASRSSTTTCTARRTRSSSPSV